VIPTTFVNKNAEQEITLGHKKSRISTALLLAAGTGSRLQPLTDDSHKCLTEVNGITILERMIRSLRAQNIDRLVVVVGHLDRCVRDFLEHAAEGMTVEYIWNQDYRTTNNIYSLWAARHAIQEPFLLLECDLVFDDVLLDDMLEPDRIAVSRILPWMNGTTVSLDPSHWVTQFHMGGGRAQYKLTHKTVNMYSFSQPSWKRITRRLDQYVSTGRVNEYYEAVFAELVAEGNLSLEAVFFNEQRWYEIDTLQDLHKAEQLFPRNNGRRSVAAVGA
jgi:choline kinase